MGEAKRRGTFEQRKAEAEERCRQDLLDRIDHQRQDTQPRVVVIGESGRRVNVGTVGHISHGRHALPLLLALASVQRWK